MNRTKLDFTAGCDVRRGLERAERLIRQERNQRTKPSAWITPAELDESAAAVAWPEAAE